MEIVANDVANTILASISNANDQANPALSNGISLFSVHAHTLSQITYIAGAAAIARSHSSTSCAVLKDDQCVVLPSCTDSTGAKRRDLGSRFPGLVKEL